MSSHVAEPIDHHRPWIRDERDDPSQMDWIQTLFNPFGMTGKLHFSRAWSFMFMGRVLLFIVPVVAVFIASMAGASLGGAWKPLSFFPLPVPALLVPFFVFTIVTEFTSWVAHVRRFGEANRSTLLAMIVLIPLTLGLAGFALGVMGGIAGYEQTQKQAAVESTETGAEGDASAAKADEKPAAGNQGAQHARRGPPPTMQQMAMGGGMSLGTLLWLVASLPVMLWTLLYVARMPNGGVGPFRTGSDLTQEEQRQQQMADSRQSYEIG